MIECLTSEQREEIDFEIADAETRRSAAHHRNVRGWPEFGFDGVTAEYAEAMLDDRVFRAKMATDMFLDNPVARTATLGIIHLRGDWRRDIAAQDSLVGPHARLITEYDTRVFERDDPDNNLQHAIDAGIVSMNGVAMDTRQRRLALTDDFEQEFVHASGNRVMARVAIAVTKLSTFAVDLERLRDYPDAAQEIHEIILAGMVIRANKRKFRRIANVMGDFDYTREADDIELDIPANAEERAAMADVREERATMDSLRTIHEKMRKYDISADVLLGRVATANSLRVHRPETIEALEHATVNRTGLLAPITTTFYGRRIFKSLSR